MLIEDVDDEDVDDAELDFEVEVVVVVGEAVVEELLSVDSLVSLLVVVDVLLNTVLDASEDE